MIDLLFFVIFFVLAFIIGVPFMAIYAANHNDRHARTLKNIREADLLKKVPYIRPVISEPGKTAWFYWWQSPKRTGWYECKLTNTPNSLCMLWFEAKQSAWFTSNQLEVQVAAIKILAWRGSNKALKAAI